MPPRKIGFKKAFIYVIPGIIILLGLLSVWLYAGPLTPAKARAFQILPLPIALVNGSPLFMNNFSLRYQLSQKILGNTQDTDSQTRSAIFNQLAAEEQLRQVAQANGVFVSQKQIDAEYQERAAQADLQGKNSFEELLRSYGLSAAVYKSQVIAPELIQVNLQIWFNGQKSLNPLAHSQAENLLQRIKSGEDMAVLAVSFSADENSRSVGGDLGFIDPARALPELRDPLSEMQVGETRILPSRLGLQIVRVEEKNGNNLHLRQIFLQAGDFNEWYSQQIQNYKIKKLINF